MIAAMSTFTFTETFVIEVSFVTQPQQRCPTAVKRGRALVVIDRLSVIRALTRVRLGSLAT